MILDFLPKNISNILNDYIDELYEIRLRLNFPIKIKIGLKNYYLSDTDITEVKEKAIKCNSVIIKDIINNVTSFSLYAYNDTIKKGYITTPMGVRIGLAGECVYLDDKIKTIKNIASLNIRIPHKIIGASNKILKYILNSDDIYNTLIVSPPMRGKTTILKDLAENLSNIDKGEILIIDERGEFSEVNGVNIDKISFGDKLFAFEYGLRSLSPNIVIADELSTISDWQFAEKTVNSGVKLIASCHASDIEQIKNKKSFIDKVFDRYIILNAKNEVGQVDKVYDKGIKLI